MKVLYGIEGNYVDVTSICLDKLVENKILRVPKGDNERAKIFGDPVFGTLKHIKIDNTIYTSNEDVFLQIDRAEEDQKHQVIIIIGLYTSMEYLTEAKNNKNIQVYAFEPNKVLVEEIYKNYNIPENYHIIDKAVSNQKCKMMFNVCSNPTCSSLQKWGNGPSFGNMTEIEVECIRMDDFILEHGIKEVEYLQIDTQGHDLFVMQGFGDKFNVIKRGVCESLAPHTKWRLYENQHSFQEFEEFIKSKNYNMTWEYNKGCGCPNDEINITFTRD